MAQRWTRRCQALLAVVRYASPRHSSAAIGCVRLGLSVVLALGLIVVTIPEAFVGTGLAAPSVNVPVRALGAGSRIRWQGQSWYLHGANVPWLNWAADFGGGTNNGVSSSASQATLRAAFQQAKASGVHTLRWWVFEGDPWQIRRDSSGAPTSLDPAIYPDFDAALALAETYDMSFDFVLFSGAAAIPSPWLSNTTQRNQLGTVLEPLFARYASNPRVMTWEVFNEPDFDVWNGKVTQDDLRSTVQVVASAVHRQSSAYVTVGMGFADGLPMVQGLGLDYYQAHWYDPMSSGNYCMRCNSYSYYQSKYGLDGPLVVGEMYAGSDTDALQRLEDMYTKGYAGAWPWSMFPNQTSDHMAIDWAAMQTFNSRHADLGPRSGSAAPTATPTAAATLTPTSVPATATATPTMTRVPATATATGVPATATATATATRPPATATATRVPATATPTKTPTAVPPTPTTVTTAATYTLTGSVNPARAKPGTSVAVSVNVKTSATTSALVDVEIYAADGTRMLQHAYDNQAFTAGQSRQFNLPWAIPASAPNGTYYVMVGTFSPGWSTFYAWNSTVATVTVSR